jgi:hypothetical protein
MTADVQKECLLAISSGARTEKPRVCRYERKGERKQGRKGGLRDLPLTWVVLLAIRGCLGRTVIIGNRYLIERFECCCRERGHGVGRGDELIGRVEGCGVWELGVGCMVFGGKRVMVEPD